MKKGTTRIVYLVGRYAVKIPRINKWKSFLKGILGNLDETLWWRNSPDHWKEYWCPVLFCSWLGFIMIMRRADPLTDREYKDLDPEEYFAGQPLQPDIKIQNFGKINGQIIMIDYADSRYFCSDCENIFKCINYDNKNKLFEK